MLTGRAGLLRDNFQYGLGDPTLLAVREGDRFTLYQLEPAKFRLPGKNWLEFIGKRAGTVEKKEH